VRAGTLDRAAHRFADRLGVDDRFFVDGIRRRRLCGVRFNAERIATARQLDQLDRGGRDVESDDRSGPALEQHG